MQQNQNMKIKAGVLSKSPANIYTLADLQTAFTNMYRLLFFVMIKYSMTAFRFEFSEAVFMFTYASDCGDIISRRQIKTKTGKA